MIKRTLWLKLLSYTGRDFRHLVGGGKLVKFSGGEVHVSLERWKLHRLINAEPLGALSCSGPYNNYEFPNKKQK